MAHDVFLSHASPDRVAAAAVREGLVRVTGQLLDGADGGYLWPDRCDRDLTDIFAIQSEITYAIVEQPEVNLLRQERRSSPATTRAPAIDPDDLLERMPPRYERILALLA